jgi:ribosomal protein S18 acetylase RimI-like enzyme
MSEASNPDSIDCFPLAQSVERVGTSELGVAARVLAEAYVHDPVLLWAMPKMATRLSDATAFFTFYLHRMLDQRREVFVTSDRSAVAVMTSISVAERESRRSPHTLRGLVRKPSTAADFIRWIETFQPDFNHKYLEFIGILPTHRSKGLGSMLLRRLLELSELEGLPVWSWSSNPRNLPFYRRLGFEIGNKLRRDAGTPAVTLLFHPVSL